MASAKALAGLIVLILLLPFLYWLYLFLRAKFSGTPKSKADHVYQLALYQYHMAGVERANETPLAYATTKVDPIFKSDFAAFMTTYLRLKYGNAEMLEGDREIIDRFASTFGPTIRSNKQFFPLIINYFNLLLASRYFKKTANNEYDNQTTPS